MTVPDPPATPLAIQLFGPFEVRLNGAPLPRLHSRKGLWLLTLLALRSGQPVERDWLAGTLWPESSPAHAFHSLRMTLFDLRRALGPEACRLQSPTCHALMLELTGAEVDLLTFDAAIRQGEEDSLERAVGLYRGPLLEGCAEEWAFQERQAREQAYLAARERLAALSLERGEAGEAERHLRLAVAVDPLREGTQRALMRVLAASGNYAAALLCYRELRLYLRRELNTEPDAETQTLFQHLRREARRLAAKGSGTPAGTERPREGMRNEAFSETRNEERGMGKTRLRRPSFLIPHSSFLIPRSSFLPELPAAVLREALTRGPLVGWEAELAALERRLDATGDGRGATCFLAGEPGIGKTRLATEACARARQRGFRVLAGRCDEHGAAPYQPFVEALRAYLDRASPAQAAAALPPPVAGELARLVPRLVEKVKELPRVAPAAGAVARQALVEAMGDFFALLTAGQQPVLLFLDDLHWADEGSLAMLHHLARRAQGLRLLIAGTYRDLPPDLQRPLEQALAALNRERLAERIPLRRLPEAGVAQMVNSLLPAALPPAAFVSALHQETEGNPFFIEEVLQHLVEEGAISREDGRWQIQPPAEIRVPPSVQAAIGRRLERLSAGSREALTLAAVIGPQFDFEVLLQATVTSDESRVTSEDSPDSSLVTGPSSLLRREEERLLGWVEEWLGARLVLEDQDRAAIHPLRGYPREPERYRFQHALIREVLYDGVSRRRQARLHERVGLALEAAVTRGTRVAGAGEEPLEELARHFSRARSGAAVEKGVDYCLRAGTKAHHLNADAEAIQHLQGALRLLHALPEDEAHLKRRWQAADGLAAAYRARLEWEEARQVLEEYLARAQRAGYAWGAAAAHDRLAVLMWREFRDTERARQHSETSLALCEQEGHERSGGDLLPEVRSHLAYLLTFEPGSDFPRAEALLRQTLESCERLAPAQVQATYGMLMLACARQGKLEGAMTALRESIAVAGLPNSVLFGLNQMEAALDAQGKQAEFLAFCEEARRLLPQTGTADPLAQWYLAPAEPYPHFTRVSFQDDFAAPELRREWQWENPHPPAAGTRASAYSLTDRSGSLTLRAGEGVDLNPVSNINAPRLLLEVRGDFALEVRMEGDWDERREVGSSGLLVWKDVLNYLRLEKFCMDPIHYGSIQLEARIQGEFRNVGRGLLRGDAFYLRLEREGERFTALCSADGVSWLTCGHVDFPARDPLLVGIASLRGVVAHFDYVRVLAKR